MKSSPADKIITPLVALEKIKSWCAYQERSQHETRLKLTGFKLEEETIDSILAELIEQNFLNEERFALAFTSGKFKIKQWGKIKIRLGLKQHRVSDYCINKALKSIDGDEYDLVIKKVIEKKARLLKFNDKQKRYYTLLNYAASRGFERDLVIEQLNLILNNN